MLSKRTYILIFLLFSLSIETMASEAEYRLTPHIKPSFQQITLKIDPDNAAFSGESTITIDVTKATKTIEFYQIDLDIKSAVLIDGERKIPLMVSAADYNIQHATSEKTIQPNRYELHIVFSGNVNTTSDGMYLAKFEQRNYIFTQFEDMHARRAFPSFDEPHFKIPYQVTIQAPLKHTVISNTPVYKRTVLNAWQTVEFEKTKPMPTYIVAFAVGEFDSAEITGLSVPGRIYTPKGQSHRTKFVIKHTPQILQHLETYFGSPYPYQKLDFVAVPNFTHGAMENAGLVTYRSSLLLLDDNPRLTEQRSPLSIVAHELAHMWYGNLVTMAWWEDLWLNEAFASWMASKVMLDLYPEQNYLARQVQESAFGEDSNPITKPIRKVVRSQTDVMDGLGLNYTKGESILQLIESLVGKDEFQQAVQEYMQIHAWRNTQADDLWKVLSSVASFDVPAMMRTYLEQAGYPLVEFSQNGMISQKRYHLSGTKVEEQVWTVPLSISYKKNEQLHRTNLFLTSKNKLATELSEADWIFPNDNAMGYMRWKIPASQLTALLRDIQVLNSREKKALLYNTEALLKAAEISLKQYMAVLDALAEGKDPVIARAVVSSLRDFVYLVDDSNEMIFGKFIEAKLLPWFERLGTTELPDDSNDLSRLRTAVFSLLGQYSQNVEVRKASIKVTEQYLNRPASVPRSIATVAMRNVAKTGDAKWLTKFKDVFMKTSDANTKSAIRSSMSFPQSENVQQVLDLALTENVGPADTIGVLAIAGRNQQKSDALYTWLEKHMLTISAKMPAYHIARMPEYVSASCSDYNINLASAFYLNHMNKYDGMPRSYEVAMQESRQCVKLKELNQQVFTDYLKTTMAKANTP